MPLLDFFRPPLDKMYGWNSLHASWSVHMAMTLNTGLLPPGYYALPYSRCDGPAEFEVAAFDRPPGFTDSEDETIAAWTAPDPAIAVAVELPPVTGSRVFVVYDNGERTLVAAVELLSPRNKDRASARSAFVSKCRDYLQQGGSLIVVDTVTNRRANLHAELFVALDAAADPPQGLAAVAYQVAGREAETQELRIWPGPLALGAALPTLPLWITEDVAVPLDLEATYAETCRKLRVPGAT